MRFTLLIYVFASIACNARRMHAQDPPATKIPGSVTSYVKDHLPGWQLVDTADYAPIWWSFYDKKHVPYFITVDIDDDGQADHAMLVKRPNEVRLLLIMGKTGGEYTHHFVNDFFLSYHETARELTCGLAVEPPTQIDVVYPEERSLLLASNAIALMELEHRERIIYWHNDTIKTFYAK